MARTQGSDSFGAYVPDLPGCVVVFATRQEVTRLSQEAIEFHTEGMRADGQALPPAAIFGCVRRDRLVARAYMADNPPSTASVVPVM